MDPRTRTLLFVGTMVILLSASSLYVAARHIAWFDGCKKQHRRLQYALALFVLLEAIGFASLRLYPAQLNTFRSLYWTIYSLLGLYATLFFYTLVTDIFLGGRARLMKAPPTVDFSRRSALLVGGISIGSTLAGAQQALSTPHIKEVDIPIKGLDASLDGFKIVQITDLHVGPTIDKSYTENVVRLANQLAPDLIALTGDFVDGTVQQLWEGVAPLSQLKAVHGMFYITGNHEYMWDAEEWIAAFKKLGADVLMNEHRIIQHGKAAFVLAGVTDYNAERHIPAHASSPSKAIAGAPMHLPKILLAHQPVSYKDSAPAGFDLQLSGHTHGGQFFPFNLAISLVQRYYKGLNRHENMWVYVNCGTGYWGPPNRLGVPAEITLIRLRAA